MYSLAKTHPSQPSPNSLIMKTPTTIPPSGAPLRRVLTVVLLLALALGAATHAARAADANPPDRMTYQGYLADANGNPLATNAPVNYDVVFRIYSDQTGGTLIWVEKQTVTVDKGQFSVLLGEGSVNASEPRPALNAVFASASASDRFLDLTVTIGTTPLNIAPRLRLVTSPYAFLASRVSGAGVIAASNLEPTLANGLWTASGANVYRSGGNVGIGTAAPGYTLHINGSVGSSSLETGNMNAGQPRFRGVERESSIGGAYLQWGNRAPGSYGQTYLLNQKEGGNPGIFLGELANNGSGVITPSLFTTPSSTRVYGVLNVDGRIFSGGPGSGGMWVDGGSQQFVGSYDSTRMGLYNNGDWRVVVNDSGNVGIGTARPTRARLEIGPYSGSYSIGAYGFAGINGYYPNQAAGTFSASVFAADQIAASGFVAFSDARIKRSEGRSDGARDLAILAGMEVTDYFYIDTVAKGKGRQKKVIAQQIETVYPQAVSRLTEVVPDIFQKAMIKDGWVTLTTSLRKGDRVRLIGEKKEGIHEVLEVTPEKFRTGYAADSEQVFVYGREVNDFRTVDYDAISMLNVSATQELARRLVKVEQRETHLSALEEKAARVEKLEREMAELKLLVARLAGQRPAERPAAEAGPASVNPAAQQ